MRFNLNALNPFLNLFGLRHTSLGSSSHYIIPQCPPPNNIIFQTTARYIEDEMRRRYTARRY